MNSARVMPAHEAIAELKEARSTERMPVLFIGHGNPMNALEDNVFSRGWKKFAASMPKPKVILCLSAHWVTQGSFVTAMPTPPTIHDFYGFPEALYQVRYPAKGDPALAQQICKIVREIQRDENEWGLDHGAWSVLLQMYPQADVPVLQLSVDASRSPAEQYELVKELASLRNKGVLFLGSGNIVHNLYAADWNSSKPYDWALEFDEQSAKLAEKGDHAALIQYEKLGAAAKMAIPTDEHYRPMLAALALQQKNEPLQFFNEGIELGSISMRSFVIGS